MVVDSTHVKSAATKPVLFLVEGIYDIEFLTILSDRLQPADLGAASLSSLVRAEKLLIIPMGGGSPRLWVERLAPLACRELHLYDREAGTDSEIRYECAEIVNRRPGCRAFVTEKRSLENYLHPTAIEIAGGGCFRYTGDDNLAACVALDWYQRTPQPVDWNELTSRARSRLLQRAKKWLCTAAIKSMTTELLLEQDPDNHLLNLFRAVLEMTA